jgi:hypothetical protein
MTQVTFRRIGFFVAAPLAIACALGTLTPAASSDFHSLLQAFGITPCTKNQPCQTFSNSGVGPGVEGISAKGKGVAGFTAFNSTSATNAQAGVFGVDHSSTGTFDSGVFGASNNGIGVQGTSVSGTAVVAQSQNGVGLLAISTNSTGILDAGAFNGVDAATNNQSLTTHRFFSGVFGHDNSTDGGHVNQGVAGTSTNGVGVFASSTNWIGAHVQGGFFNSNTAMPALSVNGNGSGFLIEGCGVTQVNPCGVVFGQPLPVFQLDESGNIGIAGQIFTSGTCKTGCISTRKSGEKRVRFFTPRESLPTVEDFGKARLVSGQAYVRLDPTFANTIDESADYLVFITPEGDNNGLYIASKSPAGFAVRESHGGRSTLSFDYRVVAKPYGEHAARLQMVTVGRPGTPLSGGGIRGVR